MENIGRDKITQSGNGSSIKIDNKTSDMKHWYQKWWGQIFIGVIVIVVGTILTKFSGLTK